VLAKRIIPCLDVTGGRVVKGVNFVELRDAGDPVEIAARYNDQGADELTFLDITATSDGRDVILHIIEAVASQVFIPLTVGGGVRTVEDVRRLLNAGADKVSFNSAALANPPVIRDASTATARSASWWPSTPSATAKTCSRVDRAGMCTAMVGARTPGSMPWRGPSEMARARRGRNFADQHGPRWHQVRLRPGTDPCRERCGGCAGDRLGRRGQRSTTWPMACSRAGADAVLGASIFHYGEYTVAQAKACMARQGIPVRI
jgi:cyclase